MPLATTRRSGLVDQVIGQIRAAIAAGEWPVGERIPPESELVTALGVGRNTVREAVRALAHSGLLEVRQGDGTFVRTTSELSGAVRRLCGTELTEVLQVRRALEVEAARLAATVCTPPELRRLRDMLRGRAAALAAGAVERFVDADAAFHLEVVRSSHNGLLLDLYQGMTEAIRASVASTVDSPEEHTDTIEHDGLLAAIAERDPDRAAAEAGGFLDELLAPRR